MYVTSGTREGIADADWFTETLRGQSSVERPVVLAAMQTFNDATPAAIRIKDLTSSSFSFQVEEEIARQTPPAHHGERVGYIAFRDLSRPQGSRDPWALHGAISNVAETAIETFAQTDTLFRTVSREERLGTVAVFPQVLTAAGSDPVHTRLTDVEGLLFRLKMEEFPAGAQGTQPGSENIHEATERIGWAALGIGTHRLQQVSATRALQLEVGTIGVSTSDWTRVTLESRYLGAPVVVSHCQTFNNPAPVVTRINEVTGWGLEFSGIDQVVRWKWLGRIFRFLQQQVPRVITRVSPAGFSVTLQDTAGEGDQHEGSETVAYAAVGEVRI